MKMEDVISDLQAEQLASLKIVTEITNDLKVLEDIKIHFGKIVAQLDAKDAVNGNKFIHINVGGDSVTLSTTSTELHADVNYLFALLSAKYIHLILKDRNGKAFLDLDVRWVEPQLNWLRDMAMCNGEETSMPRMSTVQPLWKEGHAVISDYFQASHTGQSSEAQEKRWLSAQSSILREYPAVVEAMQTMLHPADKRCLLTASLLYRSSRDKYSATSFHKHCDGHKNTLCVIRDAKNNIFGGFTGDVTWKTVFVPEHVSAPNSFLFSLVRNGKFEFVKFNGTQRSAVTCSRAAKDSFLFAFNLNAASFYDLCVRASDGICQELATGHENPSRYSLADGGHFIVSELEVFEISFNELQKHRSDSIRVVPTSSTACNCMSTSYASHSSYASLPQYSISITSRIASMLDNLKLETQLLGIKTSALLNELKFVARHVGITVPIVNKRKREAETCSQNLTELQSVVNEIDAVVKLLTVDIADTSDVVTSDASSIVYINAGGRKIATTKATLLQAPSGLILANMTSDVWGHDVDSEGNIFQDVNPDLFTAIINHLRLKALLPASEVPPITVYAEQKTALDNLLAFYMIQDVKVKLITDVAITYLKC